MTAGEFILLFDKAMEESGLQVMIRPDGSKVWSNVAPKGEVVDFIAYRNRRIMKKADDSSGS